MLTKAVASIVIPFAISAMLAIWELLKGFSTTPEGNFILISLIMMFVGFIYLIAVVMKISTKKNWRNKLKKLQ